MTRRLLMVMVLLASLTPGHSASEEPLRLIRMLDEDPFLDHPSPGEIAQFLSRQGDFFDMTPEELGRDPGLASQILAESQIFEELSRFRQEQEIVVKVRFIKWTDAFRYFSDYVLDSSSPPITAQLGDTWAAYFRALGVMPYKQRLTWDVRVLWYWKDLVQPKDLADGDAFLSLCQRLHDNPPPALVAPFAIPTAPDWNLLHDLAIWLYNAGVPSLISTRRVLGVLPWKEATLATPEGEKAARFLIDLAKHDYVALPDEFSTEIAEDFLSRKFAMAILGPWMAARAEKKLGSNWETRIGANLPPSIGAPTATTFKGGSFLVVLDPSRGKDPVGVERARLLIDQFVSTESQREYARTSGDLPANPRALAESAHIRLFQEALDQGHAYTPSIPEWAPVVENLTTRDNLYAFWKRLSALTDARASVSDSEQLARERLVLAALRSAQADINRQLSPGKVALLWPWLAVLLVFFLPMALISTWRRRVERRRGEERLRASEKRYRDLYDHAPDMFCSVDLTTGRITDCNQMLVAKTGYAKEEILGRHIFQMYQPDCMEEVQKAAQAFRKSGQVSHVELQLRRKDGRTLDVSLNVSAVRNKKGEIVRSRSVWRDITEQKKSEEAFLRQLQELSHVARVATVGELAASLAHQLNQPLTAIVANGQAAQRLLQHDGADLGEVRDVLVAVVGEGKRAGEVIRGLRSLLKKGRIERIPVQINRVIQEIVKLLRGEAVMKDILIGLDLGPNLPPVVGNRIQLQQVVLNLILNASEAMASLHTGARHLRIQTRRAGPNTVEVAVRDSGTGLDPSVQD
ncbi:MAG: extracellular solute-binding protein, partial [Acidobacteriota bacterium]